MSGQEQAVGRGSKSAASTDAEERGGVSGAQTAGGEVAAL
jgi:hypothetical protein